MTPPLPSLLPLEYDEDEGYLLLYDLNFLYSLYALDAFSKAKKHTISILVLNYSFVKIC